MLIFEFLLNAGVRVQGLAQEVKVGVGWGVVCLVADERKSTVET